MEHQVESHGAAQHLRQITGADSHFAHQPVWPTGPLGIPVTATLSEVLAGHDAQASGNYLHEDRHQAGESYDPQQRVFEPCAALQICSPVAGVHVADADQNRRSYERPPLLPESRLVVRHLNGTVDAFQRYVAATPSLSLGLGGWQARGRRCLHVRWDFRLFHLACFRCDNESTAVYHTMLTIVK